MNFLTKIYRKQDLFDLSETLKSQVEALDHELLKYDWSEKLWKELWAASSNYVICTLGENELVGFSLWLEGDELELLKIAIMPEYRGKGVAQEFFKTCLCDLGSKVVFLEVEAGNSAARNFYQKLGFKTLNKVEKYYRDGSDCLKMALNIDFSHNN